MSHGVPAQTRTFGYSARVLFGKDHRRPSLESNDEGEYLPSKRNIAHISDGAKKLLKYTCILQDSTGKQFDNVLGRLHWMLKTSGPALDLEDEDSVDEAFITLRDVVLDNNHSTASRWKAMELLELRANNWKDSDSIADYYEDPANFMVPNNNMPKLTAQVNSGKPIKYTRTFLLGCWSSPLCKVMPSNLQHTIANSDIAYIIRSPPFDDPARILCRSDESVAPIKRSISLPESNIQTNPTPAKQSSPSYIRSMSNTEEYKLGGVAYYNAPAIFHQEYVPVLHKEAWQRLFKNAIQQIEK